MSVATDKDNYELRSGDMVREVVTGVSTYLAVAVHQFEGRAEICLASRRPVNLVQVEYCTYGVHFSLSYTTETSSKMAVFSLHTPSHWVQSLLEQSAPSSQPT